MDVDAVLLDPAAVGLAARVEILDFRVFHQAVVRDVEIHHRAGAEASVARDAFGRDVEDARLGGEDEKSVFRQRPTRGPQSIAVERRAGRHAVGERDGGGTVPRLHQRGVVLEEAAHVVAHVVLGAPGLRHEHQHRMRQVAPGVDEQLEDVVERGGVGLAAGGDVEAAHLEGVEVALDGVDLAVVREHAERVREVPGGEGVGGVALMDERDRRGEVGIGEVGIELLHLRREEKSLVDDGARRQRADVGALCRFLDLAADLVEDGFVRAVDEELPDARHHSACVVADGVGIGRHLAPRQHAAAVLLDRRLDRRLFALAAEKHADAKVAVDAKRLAEERFRNLQEQSRAVARLGIVAGRATMHEALQYGQPRRDDGVARRAVQIRHQPDAARVVLILAPIEPLLSVHFAVPLHFLEPYSTVTDLARLRGWSISQPRNRAT